MATMTETPETVTTYKPSHDYHAEAHVLSGELKRPIEQTIERHAPVALRDRRGGHLTRFTEDVSIEGLITFTKGHTRVSGARSLKNNGWITLSNSVIEGFNVFEIITADRVVSQVSTDHAYLNGHVPRVTFLGTQFVNLRVSGFPVTLNINLGMCGDIPPNGKSYLRDREFLKTIKAQTKQIADARGLPKDLKQQYDEKLACIDRIMNTCDADDNVSREPITCSVVQSIDPIPIPGVQTFGHILVIPEFGSVALGEIEIGEKMYEGSERPDVYFQLTGVNLNLGCVGHGSAMAATAAANGHSHP